MDTFISHNAQETEDLGQSWGRAAGPGWVIGLTGELGAGKTQLVKGLARSLDIPGRILSPTFVLVHEYHGGHWPLYHLDFYRLNHAEEIVAAGLQEYFFRNDGITVIEWVDRWQPSLSERVPSGSRYRHACLEVIDEFQRRIRYEDFGT